jgi:hypothetical protein
VIVGPYLPVAEQAQKALDARGFRMDGGTAPRSDAMGPTNEADRKLLEKIKRLPPEKAAEVESFIDFLAQRQADRELARAATRISEDTFTKVWDKDDDAEYDRL